MATKESGAYAAHNGRPDPGHPGLSVCSRCGMKFNDAGQTVDAEGAAIVAHPGDCTVKKAVTAVVPLEGPAMPPPSEPPPPWNADPATVNQWGGKKKKK